MLIIGGLLTMLIKMYILHIHCLMSDLYIDRSEPFQIVSNCLNMSYVPCLILDCYVTILLSFVPFPIEYLFCSPISKLNTLNFTKCNLKHISDN